MINMRGKRPVADRFLASVVKRGKDECWPFRNRTSYGYMVDDDGKFIGAHRVAYRVWVGPLEAGKEIMHTCDNPPCVNPRHLVQGTHVENMQDRENKGRGRYGRTP